MSELEIALQPSRTFGVAALARTFVKVLVAFIAFLLVGNLTILASTVWMKHTARADSTVAVPGIENFRAIDERVWRGGAPEVEGYRALAARGVRTIVDLRAENAAVPEPMLASLGMRLVRIPVRDGQPPTAGQVRLFNSVVSGSPGLVYVHCQAGVGRTGSMVAGHLVSTGKVGASEAVRKTLEVGPPSLEQIAFIRGLEHGSVRSAPLALTVVSRVLDAPRRIWSYVG